ncbi:hypothetical protein R3P38DRAFT_3358223 [Favolaschia claudopus]|uniref:Uncharacterized protein n=1 Tax=Favolaschia claudopus TaxID=2862362 RepID=A0AAW0B5S6_9AGAR
MTTSRIIQALLNLSSYPMKHPIRFTTDPKHFGSLLHWILLPPIARVAATLGPVTSTDLIPFLQATPGNRYLVSGMTVSLSCSTLKSISSPHDAASPVLTSLSPSPLNSAGDQFQVFRLPRTTHSTAVTVKREGRDDTTTDGSCSAAATSDTSSLSVHANRLRSIDRPSSRPPQPHFPSLYTGGRTSTAAAHPPAPTASAGSAPQRPPCHRCPHPGPPSPSPSLPPGLFGSFLLKWSLATGFLYRIVGIGGGEKTGMKFGGECMIKTLGRRRKEVREAGRARSPAAPCPSPSPTVELGGAGVGGGSEKMPPLLSVKAKRRRD